MELTLSVVSYHRFTSEQEANKRLSVSDGPLSLTIGRSPQSDWHLPDPERIISGQHARVELRGEQFVLFDTSTNGLYINRAVDPLGHDESHVLEEGDLITLGDYEIEASFVEAEEPVQQPLPAAVSAAPQKESQLPADDDMMAFGIPASQLQTSAESSPERTSEVVSAIDNLSGLDESFMPPVAESSVTADPFASQADAIPEDWNAMLSGVGSPEPTPPVQPAAAASPAPVSAAPSPSTFETQPQKAAVAERQASQPASMPSQPSDAMSAFVRGLGISEDMVPADADEQWWFKMGSATQDLMNGLMDALRQRTEFKYQYRMNQTMFQQQENNPLKFSATLEDAIHNLFNRKGPSFMSAERAIKEAFADIEKHDRALMAGIDGAVGGLMKMLSPDAITGRQLQQSLLDKLNPAQIKARQWAIYEALYQDLEGEMNGANKAFYQDDFVKAYESKLKGLN